MVVRNNIPALNSWNKLDKSNKKVSKSLKNLASGFRINNAADDASGLAVSEKMRAQITGLNQAVKNSRDGQSFINTAEGAMTEIHSMLNRIVELSEQSSNGVYEDMDREAIQQEVDQLKAEINRIDENTDFNDIPCFRTSSSGSTGWTPGVVAGPAGGAHIEAANVPGKQGNTEVDITVSNVKAGMVVTFRADTGRYDKPYDPPYDKKVTASYDPLDGLEISMRADNYWDKLQTVTYKYTQEDINQAVDAIRHTLPDGLKDIEISLDMPLEILGGKGTAASGWIGRDHGYTTILTTGDGAGHGMSSSRGVIVSSTRNGSQYNGTMIFKGVDPPVPSNQVEFNGKLPTVYLETNKKYSADEINQILRNAGADYEIKTDKWATTYGITMRADGESFDIQITGGTDGTAGGGSGSLGGDAASELILFIGESAEDYNFLRIPIYDVSTSALDLEPLDVLSQEGAARALGKAKNAINNISGKRGTYGGFMNRLDHTVNNLSNSSVNITAAESRIRDVDMAREMMDYTRSNILSQSAQAMLSQANQQPQSVLQLMQ